MGLRRRKKGEFKNSVCMMRDEEIQVVRALEYNANLSATEIARQLDRKESQVRKIIDDLTERGVLKQKKAFVNLFALGLTDYTFFMQSTGSPTSDTWSAIEQFPKNPKVFWMASFIGEYQFAVALFGKQPVDVALTVDELLSQVGLSVSRKDLSVRIHFTALGRRYLSKRPTPELVYSFPKTKQEYDDTDLTIIQRLSTGAFESIRSLSKELNIPLATLSRRIQRLEDTKIIGGYYHWVSAHHFGVREYRLLISIANNHKSIRKGIVDLCERIPQVTFLVNCLGAWDCEIGCDVVSYQELLRIIDEVYKIDPRSIVDVRVLEIVSHLKTG